MQQSFSKPNDREQAKMEVYVNKKYTDKNFHLIILALAFSPLLIETKKNASFLL
jgi:hypothetical protein